MYEYLSTRWGETAASWATGAWYAVLLIVVLLSFAAPAGVFRYGTI